MFPNNVFSATEISPPFVQNEVFVVTRGYDTPSTHVGKDRYALDLTQGGCAAYRKKALAVDGGSVAYLNDFDQWGGGYGFFVDVTHFGEIRSRYAHLDSVLVTSEQGLVQGEAVGLIGHTGAAYGKSCPQHPGTHLHFVMYKEGQAYRPEPMQSCTIVSSGTTPCVNFAAGEWYRHDVALAEKALPAESLPISAAESQAFLLLTQFRQFVEQIAGALDIAVHTAAYLLASFLTDQNAPEASLFAGVTSNDSGQTFFHSDSDSIPAVALPIAALRELLAQASVVDAAFDANDTDIPDAHDTGVSVNDDNDNDSDSDNGDAAAEDQEAQNDESLNVQEVQDDETSNVQGVQDDETSNVQEAQQPLPSFGVGRPYGPLGPGAISGPTVTPLEPTGPVAPYLLALAEPEGGWGVSHPTLAASASQYLVAWTETKFDSDIGTYLYRFRGRFLTKRGTAQGEPFIIFEAPPGHTAASLKAAGNGQTFLVVWRQVADANNISIQGIRVPSNGAQGDEASFLVADSSGIEIVGDPGITHLGSDFLVAWSTSTRSPFSGGALGAARVAQDGSLLQRFGLLSGNLRNKPLFEQVVCDNSAERCLVVFGTHIGIRAVTFDVADGSVSCSNANFCPVVFSFTSDGFRRSTRYVVFDGEQFLFAWHKDFDISGSKEGFGMYARRVSRQGTLVDAAPVKLKPSDGKTYPLLTPLLVSDSITPTFPFADTDPDSGKTVLVAAPFEIDEEGALALGEQQTISGEHEIADVPNDGACGAETCVVIVQQGRELLVLPF